MNLGLTLVKVERCLPYWLTGVYLQWCRQGSGTTLVLTDLAHFFGYLIKPRALISNRTTTEIKKN